jgi:hypothetical protein
MNNSKPTEMKALHLETYGKPLKVLRLENVAIPNPGAGQIRVRSPRLRTQPGGLGRV